MGNNNDPSSADNSESQEVKKKQFRKSHSEYMDDFTSLTYSHRSWRKWTQRNKKGFFPIFSPDFSEKMKNVSGNAIKLYIYLGMHIDNQAGYTMVSIDTMAEYFKTSSRTVHNWLKELKENKLILRIQPAFKQPTYTFLLPYHDEFVNDIFEGGSLRELVSEYNNEDLDDSPSELMEAIKKMRLGH
ncbi:helix-turn-helix domain-containing protein [Paenibacillus lautus]|uniref:helix-turn-helix domain-containing protein n=1 Tax=Paenibacillus lautus TaxID=1401 RepID=UPI001C7DDFBD|nr:helix-turn-helix domain-containing protein [Paenibacillus lautus]MBX4152308.1 helix-turn-helix domain-containing protein [Paenibacillus lautus]